MKTTTCRYCGATFTPGINGVSIGTSSRPVDLCDTCAHVERNPQGEAIVDIQIIQKLILAITGVHGPEPL
jgi:RNase P subunit RPR2